MKLTLSNPTEITVVQEVKKTIEEITVIEVLDSFENKTVKAFTEELGIVSLWEGDAYDAIGQWTDEDVFNRIKEILQTTN